MFKTFTQKRAQLTKIKQITPAEVAQMLKQSEPALILDVRSPKEYELDEHIAESRLMPLVTVPVRNGELPRDKPIVCVCRSGARSQVACEALRKQGFENLFNMTGGMMAWRRAGLATV